jgi:hypothetical protein
VLSYTIAPALPAGLNFNSSTGVISGTPTTLSPSASYVITATNSGGSTTVSVSLTVNDVVPSALSYTGQTTFTKGTAIVALSPTISGGPVLSYTIAPALPAGLSINSSTGVISGTPTALAPSASYVVTATNSGGSTTASVSLTVNDVIPSALSYPSSAPFVRGTAIVALSPTVSGGPVMSYTIAPALPAGLTINSSTGIISGTPTALAPSASYVVTATNSGGSTTASISLTVNDVVPSSLSYTGQTTFTKGTAIVALSPTSSGGPVVSYTIVEKL